MAKRRVDPILMSIVRVRLVKGEEDIGTATGFFFTKEGQIFLVTNRHVAQSQKRGVQPTHLRVHLHEDTVDLGKNVWITLPLFDDDGRPRWLEDKVSDSDILCLQVEEIRSRAAEKAIAGVP
jgi:hypothetical protein